jgi:hypothetical protein
MTAADMRKCLNSGIDFIIQGRAAILHHDFPLKCEADPDFEPITLPVTSEYLAKEGLSPAFVQYMSRWQGFVEEDQA